MLPDTNLDTTSRNNSSHPWNDVVQDKIDKILMTTTFQKLRLVLYISLFTWHIQIFTGLFCPSSLFLITHSASSPPAPHTQLLHCSQLVDPFPLSLMSTGVQHSSAPLYAMTPQSSPPGLPSHPALSLVFAQVRMYFIPPENMRTPYSILEQT